MAERDDTPGTATEDIDEDARPSEKEPNPEAIDEPTQGGEQEAEETAWMMKEMTTVGIISILALVLLSVALLQATGIVELVPSSDSPLLEWGAFAVLLVALVALFAWSRRGV